MPSKYGLLFAVNPSGVDYDANGGISRYFRRNRSITRCGGSSSIGGGAILSTLTLTPSSKQPKWNTAPFGALPLISVTPSTTNAKKTAMT
mmetsp:Transcript_8751/g.14293  ORF Transcript_8751/g.14293 Transcript_8751/m.14293 type:complete len:90 (-) Transcript_8751:186-455(-)